MLGGSGKDRDRDKETDYKFLTLVPSGEWNWAKRWLDEEECDKRVFKKARKIEKMFTYYNIIMLKFL